MHYSKNDILALREAGDIEIKKASGRDGKGALPNDFWPTYSAFANTEGGEIFLGIEENADKTLTIAGVADPARIKQDIFNLANNRQKISANLLYNDSVQELIVEGKVILKVHVRRASRKRIKEITQEHPADISKTLSFLAKEEFLKTDGTGRGMCYFLPGAAYEKLANTDILPDSSTGLPDSSTGLPGSSTGLPGNSRDFEQQEAKIAEPARTRRKLKSEQMEQIILELCDLRPQSLKKLAALVNRTPAPLRDYIVKPMVDSRKIIPLYKTINHPHQAYITPRLSNELENK